MKPCSLQDAGEVKSGGLGQWQSHCRAAAFGGFVPDSSISGAVSTAFHAASLQSQNSNDGRLAQSEANVLQWLLDPGKHKSLRARRPGRAMEPRETQTRSM